MTKDETVLHIIPALKAEDSSITLQHCKKPEDLFCKLFWDVICLKTHKNDFSLFRCNITKTKWDCVQNQETAVASRLNRNANIINTDSVLLYTEYLSVSCSIFDSRPELSSSGLRFYHVAQLWSEKARFCGFFLSKKWYQLEMILSLKGCGFTVKPINVLLWPPSGQPCGFSIKC